MHIKKMIGFIMMMPVILLLLAGVYIQFSEHFIGTIIVTVILLLFVFGMIICFEE